MGVMAGARRPLAAAAIGSILLAAGLPARPAGAADRCGVERWAVKTGTDPGAPQVDLAHPRPTTIKDLVGLTAPPHWSSSLPRQDPVETTVWVVTALLTDYKIELDLAGGEAVGGDSDYHLALSDGEGRTMIAEIPVFGCVGSQSPFGPGITASRQAFDSHLDARPSFKSPKPPIQVQVTGVGFFDKLHGQRGLAPNGIELHPVLDIQFGPPVARASTELLADGGFEGAPGQTPAGPSWATGTNLSSHPVLQPHGPDPHTGSGYARLGERNRAVDSVSQSVAIPLDAGSPSLTYFADVTSNEPAGAPEHDVFGTEVRSEDGTVLAQLDRLTNLDATDPGRYVRRGPFDLSAFAGLTVQIAFRATTDVSLVTAFRVDDASLTAQIPKAAGGGLPPSTAVLAPADGATVTGTIPVRAGSSDSERVATTEIYVDGVFRASAPGVEASFDWDTAAESNGTHAIVSKAIDRDGRAWSGSPVNVTVSNPVPAQLLGNPGFESGAAPWIASLGVLTSTSLRDPHGGQSFAWLDGYGRTHADTLAQPFSIPAAATGAELSFWVHIDTAETGTAAVDTLTVDLLGPAGIPVARLITLTNLGAADGFTHKSFSLLPYRGQALQLLFTGTENAGRQTSFVLDDVEITAG